MCAHVCLLPRRDKLSLHRELVPMYPWACLSICLCFSGCEHVPLSASRYCPLLVSYLPLPLPLPLPPTLPLPPLLDDSLAWFLVRPREVQTQLQAHMPTDVYSADIY